jgi:very-short-patch-repair endonuclease
MDKVSKSRELRRDGSRAEKICWHLIRDRRIAGIKFRRQHPIGPYFADFACLSRKLIIEIDGERLAGPALLGERSRSEPGGHLVSD